MTIEDFTNKADGLINDFSGGASDEKEFRDGILDLLLEVATPAIQVQAKVMLRIAEIAGGALTQWKTHIEENEQKDIADINHIEANTWKNVDAELKTLRSNLST